MKWLQTFLIFTVFTALSACFSQSDNTNNLQEPKYPFGDNPEACEINTNHSDNNEINWPALLTENCNKISDYNLFSAINNNSRSANSPGLLYELNSALFTDHARKYRYVFIPENTQASYQELNAFDFPVGTVLVKFFYLPINTEQPEEELLEIRLLIHRENGWFTLPYKWYEHLSDGYISVAGDSIASVITHNSVSESFNYQIPTFGQCSTCHKGEDANGTALITPIGLKARHLNKIINHNGSDINQLTLWNNLGVITGLPENLAVIDTAPNWRDESVNIEQRAKAYLDINCAHCHTDGGAGALSGLRMEYWRKEIDYLHGVCNGSQGWRVGGFDIWPGRAEISHIPMRMGLTAAKDRMPPIGRSLVENEAIALISEWINTMPYLECSSTQSP